MARSHGGRRTSRSVIFLQSGAAFAADAQVHVSIARRLPAHGFAVFAACNPGDPPGRAPAMEAFRAVAGVEVVTMRFGPEITSRRALAMASAIVGGAFSTIASTVRLCRTVRRHRIGIVHCTEKAREAIFAYVVARACGAKLVVHLHVKVEPWFSAPTRWVMHRADRLVAISAFVAASAVAMGYDPARVRVALNGLAPRHDQVDQDDPADGRARDKATDRASVRAEFGLAETALVVSIAARLNPWKGHRPLFEAFSGLGRGDVALLVIGSDGTPGVDGPAGTALRAAAVELGIAAQVHFTGFRDDADRLINASDVFAMPSFEEPFGLVFIEAMAAGVAVVGLDNGGTPEVVDDGVTGLLAAPDDTVALTEDLRRLLDDPALRTRMGDAGRRRVAAMFTADRMAADVARIYREL